MECSLITLGGSWRKFPPLGESQNNGRGWWGVELPLASSWEPPHSILQGHVRRHHRGSVKTAVAAAFTPREAAVAASQGLPGLLTVRRLPAQHGEWQGGLYPPGESLRTGQRRRSCAACTRHKSWPRVSAWPSCVDSLWKQDGCRTASAGGAWRGGEGGSRHLLISKPGTEVPLLLPSPPPQGPCLFLGRLSVASEPQTHQLDGPRRATHSSDSSGPFANQVATV